MQRTDAPEEPPVWEEEWRWYVAETRAVVPLVGLACAFGGVVIGWIVGHTLLSNGVIHPSTSAGIAPAVFAGGVAWFMGAFACMIAYRNRRPPTWEAVDGLVITAVGLVCAGLLLAGVMPTFQDYLDVHIEDPRMFRLQRLIWLDAGLAAATCLLVAQRRWKPSVAIAAMTLIGAVWAAGAVPQFLVFLEGCDPMLLGVEWCYTRRF